MQREFTIISALAGTPVPVPPVIAYLDDTDGAAGIGTPFYLMDFVAGPILARPHDNAPFSPAQLRSTSLELARVLGELHSLDPGKIKHVYFGVLSSYAVIAVCFLAFVPRPSLLITIATTLYNFALGFSCWHVTVINSTLLPPPLRPKMAIRALLVVAGLFFWCVGMVAAYSVYVNEFVKK